jgi:hypothetical protein
VVSLLIVYVLITVLSSRAVASSPPLLDACPFWVSRVVPAPTVSGKTIVLSVGSLVRLLAPVPRPLLLLLGRRIRTTSAARTVVVVVAASSAVVRGVLREEHLL